MSGIRKASTRTMSGRGASESTARCIARSAAWWMLMRSISSGSTLITDHAIASRAIRSYSRSRSSAVTVLESHTRGMYRSGSSTTAPAMTGPARQPRPTSSTPATYTNPMRRSAFSRVRYARTLTTAGLSGLFLVGFFHARRLALQLAQEVQLGAADLRGAQHVDLVDHRRVQREDALD